MRNLWVLLAFVVVGLTLCGPPRFGGLRGVASTPAPVQSFCSPVYTPQPGSAMTAQAMSNELIHSETCSGQYGDVYTDGELFTPAPTYDDTQYNYTIPANTFVANGRRVFVPQTTLTAIQGGNNYLWLTNTRGPVGIWVQTQSNSAPTPDAILEYTVTTDGSGIPSISLPTIAGIVLNGPLTFNSNVCVGPGCSSSQATPFPGNCIGISTPPAAGKIAYTCATPQPQATPSPTTTGCAIYSGSWPYTADSTNCPFINAANTFTGANTFNAAVTLGGAVTFNASPSPPQVVPSPTGSPANCPGTTAFPTPGAGVAEQATLCIGAPANKVGIALGPVANGWQNTNTVASNSAGLCFIRNNGSVDNATCIGFTSGGALSLNSSTFGGGGATSITTGSTAFSTGTANITTGPLLQGGSSCSGTTVQTGSSGTYACAITASGGAWEYDFSRTFTSATHPICMVSDETTAGGAKVTSYGTGSGTWTKCSGTSGTSDVVDVMVIGNVQ